MNRFEFKTLMSHYEHVYTDKEVIKLAEEEIDRLRKSNEAKDQTIERLESDLEEAVEIMGAIYDNVDHYHLDFAFHGGECYDRLKEYLGI